MTDYAITAWPPGSHFPYRLAIDGIVDYRRADDPRWSLVQMSRGKAPVVVYGSVAELDAAISQTAVCWLPRKDQ